MNLEGRFCLALKQGFQTPMFALGKNDTWGLTAAAICLVTWAVSLVDWACDCGLRVAAKAGFLGSRIPSRDRPCHRNRITVMGMMGVVLGCTFFALWSVLSSSSPACCGEI